ncbi:MAG: hypothetical protein ACO4AY_12410 [Ilumatobacteraceae bacterium]
MNLVVAALILTAVGVGCGGAPDEPRLLVPQAVPDDVRSELDVVWSDFRRVFAGRLGCVPDVTILLVGDVVGGDARYVVADARIEVRIPTTPARFRESVAHELAHHVEHTCREFDELRVQLNRGFWTGTWESGDDWWDTPSEQWAEHVVELINGGRVRHTTEMPIDEAALAMIRAWAAGPLRSGGGQTR